MTSESTNHASPKSDGAPPKMSPAVVWSLLRQTWAEWSEDKVPRLSAAFAYYTIFSLAPLLIVVIAIAGYFFHDKAADQISGEIAKSVGKPAADAITAMVKAAGEKRSTGVFASIAGVVTLLLGSATLFGQLQDALNTIWEVAPKPNLGWMNMLRQRFLSFSMVLGTGFLLLVSLVLSAAVAAVSTFMGDVLPIPEVALQALNFAISFAVTTVMFALIYKVLPDAEVEWRDVWIGATITSLLFGVGRFALGLYLGRSGVTSAYGAAGSLVLILLWVYYAAQILFFGAEFTQVYANSYGSKVRPSDHAIPVTDEKRAQEGLPRLSDLQSTQIASDAKQQGKRIAKSEAWQPKANTKSKSKTSAATAADAGADASRNDGQEAATGRVKSPAARVDSRDVEYLGAALLAFVATLWLSSRRHRDD